MWDFVSTKSTLHRPEKNRRSYEGRKAWAIIRQRKEEMTCNYFSDRKKLYRARYKDKSLDSIFEVCESYSWVPISLEEVRKVTSCENFFTLTEERVKEYLKTVFKK